MLFFNFKYCFGILSAFSTVVQLSTLQSIPVLPTETHLLIAPNNYRLPFSFYTIHFASLLSSPHLSPFSLSSLFPLKMSARKDAQVSSTTWLLNNIELKDISKCYVENCISLSTGSTMYFGCLV